MEVPVATAGVGADRAHFDQSHRETGSTPLELRLLGAVAPSLPCHKRAADGEQRRDNFYSFAAEKLTGVRLMTLAEMLDVTPTHLTRVCRHCAGMTAAAMLSARVLHAARTALVDTTTPVSEIADWRFAPGDITRRLVEDYTNEVTPKRAAAE